MLFWKFKFFYQLIISFHNLPLKVVTWNAVVVEAATNKTILELSWDSCFFIWNFYIFKICPANKKNLLLILSVTSYFISLIHSLYIHQKISLRLCSVGMCVNNMLLKMHGLGLHGLRCGWWTESCLRNIPNWTGTFFLKEPRFKKFGQDTVLMLLQHLSMWWCMVSLRKEHLSLSFSWEDEEAEEGTQLPHA